LSDNLTEIERIEKILATNAGGLHDAVVGKSIGLLQSKNEYVKQVNHMLSLTQLKILERIAVSLEKVEENTKLDMPDLSGITHFCPKCSKEYNAVQNKTEEE
jgi:hypothetical protein